MLSSYFSFQRHGYPLSMVTLPCSRDRLKYPVTRGSIYRLPRESQLGHAVHSCFWTAIDTMVVLAGDPRQLGPIVRSQKAKKKHLDMYVDSELKFGEKFGERDVKRAIWCCWSSELRLRPENSKIEKLQHTVKSGICVRLVKLRFSKQVIYWETIDYGTLFSW